MSALPSITPTPTEAVLRATTVTSWAALVASTTHALQMGGGARRLLSTFDSTPKTNTTPESIDSGVKAAINLVTLCWTKIVMPKELHIVSRSGKGSPSLPHLFPGRVSGPISATYVKDAEEDTAVNEYWRGYRGVSVCLRGWSTEFLCGHEMRRPLLLLPPEQAVCVGPEVDSLCKARIHGFAVEGR